MEIGGCRASGRRIHHSRMKCYTLASSRICERRCAMERAPWTAADDHVAALRARGERLTPQRLMVLAAMRETEGHHTAEAIYARVRERYPYVNLATIYRALGWLKDQALVSETDLGGGQIEYEYLGEGRHHHMVCLHCGGKAEFGD